MYTGRLHTWREIRRNHAESQGTVGRIDICFKLLRERQMERVKREKEGARDYR
jgi:hypothetical protein